MLPLVELVRDAIGGIMGLGQQLMSGGGMGEISALAKEAMAVAKLSGNPVALLLGSPIRDGPRSARDIRHLTNDAKAATPSVAAVAQGNEAPTIPR